MVIAPPLPQDAADLLAIGRRYYDVGVFWVPRGSPRSYGRDFGFWRVEAGPPGWERAQALIPPPKFMEPDRRWAPVSCEWTDARETVRRALTMARRAWPRCCGTQPSR